MGNKPTRLEDCPRPAQDELFAESDEDAAAGEADPLSSALVKLTQIVSHMNNKGQDQLEDAFNGFPSGVSGLGESGSNLGRKHAVVRQNLERAFKHHPEKIWQTMERNMEEQCHLSLTLPNAGTTTFTARGWAEHRSRIMAYPRTVRAAWGIAGVLDALSEGKQCPFCLSPMLRHVGPAGTRKLGQRELC